MGLHHIHEVRHSVHRDIKPENILLNSRGQIKITDFGVSKCIEHSFGRSLVGTITYMYAVDDTGVPNDCLSATTTIPTNVISGVWD